MLYVFFFFSSRRRHTRYWRDWSSDVCSSDLSAPPLPYWGLLRRSLLTWPPNTPRRRWPRRPWSTAGPVSISAATSAIAGSIETRRCQRLTRAPLLLSLVLPWRLARFPPCTASIRAAGSAADRPVTIGRPACGYSASKPISRELISRERQPWLPPVFPGLSRSEQPRPRSLIGSERPAAA